MSQWKLVCDFACTI